MTSQNRADNPAAYRLIDRLHVDRDAELKRLIDGLRASPAMVEPKYFYDPLGCAIYAAICQLDEYYPTRTEAAIFQQYRDEITAKIGHCGTFVDLGAGAAVVAIDPAAALSCHRYRGTIACNGTREYGSGISGNRNGRVGY